MKTKRFWVFMFVSIMLICTIPAKAQEDFQRNYIEFSVGEPFFQGLNFMSWNTPTEKDAFYTWADKNRPYIDSGIKGYEDGWFLPSFALAYYYRVLKWLAVGGECATISSCTTEKYFANHETYAYYLNTNLYVAGGVRFEYFQKSVLDLYSGLTIGANIRFHSTESNPLVLTTSRFTWQLTALGIRVGKKVYGDIEIGYGYKGFFSVGIGGRF